MGQEIELKEIWGIIQKHWLLLVCLPLLAALISGGISFYVLKPVYQSSTTLIVGKKVSALEGESARQFLDVLQAGRMLAKTYGEIAKSRTVREQVIAELGLRLTAEQLNTKINVNQVEDTEILEITVTDQDPQLAANIANVTVQKFAAAVIEIKKIDSVSIIDKAVAPTVPIKPKKTLNILIALVVGLLAAFGLSCGMEYLNNTVKTNKEAEALLGLSVLGVILDYQYDKEPKGAEHAGIQSENLEQS